MNIVGYSSSEESDTEPANTAKAAPISTQPLVQSSTPSITNKIRINLGAIAADEPSSEAPEGSPAKRQRLVGGGRFSGLNSFLPAPKRSTGQTVAAASAESDNSQSKPRRAPFTLKTSSEAAFERGEGTPESAAAADAALAKALSKRKEDITTPQLASEDGGKPKKKPMMRPLSVQGTKKKTKKRAGVLDSSDIVADKMELDLPAEDAAPQPQQKPTKPKVSLFSTNMQEADGTKSVSLGAYKPMLLDKEHDDAETTGDPSFAWAISDHAMQAQATAAPNHQNMSEPAPQSLEALYTTLSESERRQLFGRKGVGDLSALEGISVKNFNTDTEYSANEELRASGEQQEIRTVRAINPGKHSLRQLVNVAVTQKDALEESYARGAANKKEGGSKYGW